IHPHSGEGAIGNVVIGNDDFVGLEDVDAITVLAVAAALPVDPADGVAGDDRAVAPGLVAPDADAGISGAGNAVAADHQAATVLAVDRRVAQFVEAAGLDRAAGAARGNADALAAQGAGADDEVVAALDDEGRVAHPAAAERHAIDHEAAAGTERRDRGALVAHEPGSLSAAEYAQMARKLQVVDVKRARG